MSCGAVKSKNERFKRMTQKTEENKEECGSKKEKRK